MENIAPVDYVANTRAGKALSVRTDGNLVEDINAAKSKPSRIPVASGRPRLPLAPASQAACPPPVAVEADPERMDVDEVSRDVLNLAPAQLTGKLSEMELLFREPQYYFESFIHWKEAENRHLANPRYMRKQKDLDWEMRSILIDWLVEVAEEFNLHSDTLYSSISYLDRFLSIMACSRDRLQLAGVAAMFIASKYEEIYPPSAIDFVNLTDNTYTTRQLFKMEISMLKALNFKLTGPTAVNFLMDLLHCPDSVCLLTAPDQLEKLENLSKYLCEMTLVNGEMFLLYKPSQIAASVLYVASVTLEMNEWAVSVCERSTYKMVDLHACIRHVHSVFLGANDTRFRAIQDKYSDQRRYGITKEIVPPTSLPLFFN